MPRNTTKAKSRKDSVPHKIDGLADLPLEFLECRAYHAHAFRLKGFFHWRQGNQRGTCSVNECMRCTTTREDYLTSDLHLYYRAYNYPDGYVLDGKGSVSQFDALREIMRRTTIHESYDDLPGARPLSLVKSS